MTCSDIRMGKYQSVLKYLTVTVTTINKPVGVKPRGRPQKGGARNLPKPVLGSTAERGDGKRTRWNLLLPSVSLRLPERIRGRERGRESGSNN